MTADVWTAESMKVGFLGVTAHWIGVKDKIWTLKSAVIGLRAISGTHAGDNMGRYMIGVCDRVGITSKTHSKVRSREIPISSQQSHMLIDNRYR